MPFRVNGQVLTVKVGNELRPVVPCEVGQSAGGLRIELPTAGVHTLEIYGVDEDGYAYYRHEGTLSAFAGQVAHAEYDLGWAVGAAFVDWDLTSIRLTCGQAGVEVVAVQFQDAEGFFLYGDGYDTGDRFACDEYGANFTSSRTGSTGSTPQASAQAGRCATAPTCGIRLGSACRPASSPAPITSTPR